jgi:gliding motility-associated-like protein
MKRILRYCTLLTVFLSGALLVTGQNNCLLGWRYTRAIAVTNIDFGLLNDWQVRLIIDTQSLIGSGKMNADGSDIRFTTDDCCTEIPYWIQSGINTAATVIWVRVPQVVSNGTSMIQMYYGNAGATTTVSNLDLVHFSIGNDSMGTDTATPGLTVATQAYTFPFNCATVRFRIYSDDTMRVKFKVTNDTNMVTGTSPFFNVPSTTGFHNFDAELPVSAGGHPGWFTSTGGSFLNTCTPVVPCPGSCGDMVYRPLDQGVFGALDDDSCGVLPSMRVWYRRILFIDPFTDASAPEFDRMFPFAATTPGGTVMCFNDSLPILVPNVPGSTFQWFRNGSAILGATDTALTAYSPGTYYCVASTGVACQDVASNSVTLSFFVPELDLGPDVSVCSDTGYVIQAATHFQSYLWDDGSTLNLRDVTSSGTYGLTVVDSFGCSDIDSVTITIHPIPVPVVQTIGPTAVCPGETVELDAFSSDWFAYRWLPTGQTSANNYITAPGSYSVIVWDQFFCSDTSAVVVINFLPEPTFELGPPVGFCAGDSVSIDAGAGWATILWPDSSTNQTFTATASGFYRAEVTDSNGCSSIDTMTVVLYNNPTTDLGPSDTICANGTVMLDAGPNFAGYAWSNGATSQTVTVGPGAYNVVVVDTNGCSGTSSVIYMSAYPPLDLPVILGSAALLVCSSSPNYQWFVDNTLIPGATGSTHVPTISGIYTVQVIHPLGCDTAFSAPFEAYLDITLDDIPQGFSPNGDGINDVFEIQNIYQFPANSIQIMNRWGSTVYTKEPYDNTFNGTGSNGTELPDGTYFYKLDIGNGQSFQDYLIINR